MIVLGIDTALPACSAAVVRDDVVLAAISEPMSRGHQERLAVLVAEVMAKAGLAFTDLDRVAVTVGPGSFTGLRVGLAFAKAMALALGRPCVGVGSLEALAASAAAPGRVLAAIDAKRGQVYLQAFDGGAALSPAQSVDVADALERARAMAAEGPLTLVGSAAAVLAAAAPGARCVLLEAPLPEAVARLGAAGAVVPPQPLYLRAPDARLPAPRLRLAGPADAEAFAALHALSFDAPWPAADFAAALGGPGALALAAEAPQPLGLVLLQCVAGEAEVLTLAVHPDHRRRGAARALMAAAFAQAQARGASEMFLEVAEDNPAALALYRDLGFAVVGARPAYYARPGGGRADARLMRRALNSVRP